MLRCFGDLKLVFLSALLGSVIHLCVYHEKTSQHPQFTFWQLEAIKVK
jgi:hypothetical protein